MSLRLILFAAIALATYAPAQGGELRCEPVAVLELFTSQGCSSCPPADKLLAQYGEREDIIALGYHVDYWDYIGWPDTFGSPEFSDYQRSYAHARNQPRVYTPQLMVNGVADIVGSRPTDVSRAVDEAELPMMVELATNDGMLEVEIAADPARQPAHLWLVTFRSQADVEIERGENRNLTLPYTHIVTDRQIIGMWEPATGASIRLPLEDLLAGESDGAAIIVQEGRKGLPGRILGASSFSL